jgi:hypothetical protein
MQAGMDHEWLHTAMVGRPHALIGPLKDVRAWTMSCTMDLLEPTGQGRCAGIRACTQSADDGARPGQLIIDDHDHARRRQVQCVGAQATNLLASGYSFVP